MSPTHSKGSFSVSCHTGLNPLFFTELVRIVVTDRCACTLLVDDEREEDVLEVGEERNEEELLR